MLILERLPFTYRFTFFQFLSGKTNARICSLFSFFGCWSSCFFEWIDCGWMKLLKQNPNILSKFKQNLFLYKERIIFASTWSFSKEWFWLLCWFWSIPLCSEGWLIFSWSSWFEWFLCCWSFCCFWSLCCGWSFCCYWFCPRRILISTITITFSSLVKYHYNYRAVS